MNQSDQTHRGDMGHELPWPVLQQELTAYRTSRSSGRGSCAHVSLRTLATAFVSATFLLFSGVAAAQDSGVAYAGGSVGQGVNAYAGAVLALPGDRLGSGFAVRLGGSGGEYRYSANGQVIDAEYAGAELALVYQKSGQWGWANLSAGPRFTDTSLSPADPTNQLAGSRVDAALQSDGAYGQRLRLGWFGSLGVKDRSYIAQLRLGRLVGQAQRLRLGPEVGIQGNRSYTRGNIGLFMSHPIAGGMEGVLSAGLSEQAGRDAKPYAGLGLSKVF